jgi:hypothetical protein
MKSSAIRISVFTVVFFVAMTAWSQATQAPTPSADTSTNAPSLTLDEKVSLVTDDLKRQDALEKANEAFQKAIAPINEHQAVTKKVIESEHPGWTLETGAQGWKLVKKPEPPKTPATPPAPTK